MLRTHEKSYFRLVSGEDLRKTETIIQIAEEKQYENGKGYAVFLCEVVKPEEYERTTAEGRAEAAETSLQEEIEAHKIEMEEAEAKIEALEELLEQARDKERERQQKEESQNEEINKLYGALYECEKIFGSLPPEIERLYKDEEERGYK